jgi:hypothetical protein
MKIRVDALQESFTQLRGSSVVDRVALLEGLVTTLRTVSVKKKKKKLESCQYILYFSARPRAC